MYIFLEVGRDMITKIFNDFQILFLVLIAFPTVFFLQEILRSEMKIFFKKA